MSQPTTPIESPLVNRRATPMERRDAPRRVADRSVAMRGGSGSSWAWLWLVVAILGGAGGAFYYYKSHGFATGVGSADSTAASDTAPLWDTTAARTPAIPGDTAPARPGAATPAPGTAAGGAGQPTSPASPDSAARPLEPAAAAAGRPRAPDAARTPAPAMGDSGGIRVVGLPAGSTVMIDEKPVSESVSRLPPGPHAVGVSAPRYDFYADTVTVRSGEILELSPQLTPIGSPVVPPRRRAAVATSGARCEPGAGYNADGSCFDERPKPVNPPFVPVPDGVTDTPQPSLLWVKVSTEGRTVDVTRLRPSNDADFERAVRNFVWSMTWHPALKNGSPVEAWTQMLFRPAPQ